MKSSDKDAGWYPTEMGENVMLVVHFIPETIPWTTNFEGKFCLRVLPEDFLSERKVAKHTLLLGSVPALHISYFDYSLNKMEKVNIFPSTPRRLIWQ